MGEHIVRTVTCDRCGAKEVIEIDDNRLKFTPSKEVIDSIYSLPFGWDRSIRGILCPRCHNEFIDLRKQFVNKFFGDSDTSCVVE